MNWNVTDRRLGSEALGALQPKLLRQYALKYRDADLDTEALGKTLSTGRDRGTQ